MRRGLTRRRSSTASVRRCGLEDVRRQWLAAFWRCRPVTRTKPGCPPRCDTSMPPCSASAGGPAGDEQRVRRPDEIAGFLVEACQRIDHAGLGQHRFNVAGLYVLRAVAEALPDADAQTAWKSARDDPVCSVAASRAELKSEETDSTPSRRLGDPGSLSGSSAFMRRTDGLGLEMKPGCPVIAVASGHSVLVRQTEEEDGQIGEEGAMLVRHEKRAYVGSRCPAAGENLCVSIGSQN